MDNIETQANKKIFRFKPYEPGKPIEYVAREYGLDENKILKLASNENILGTSPKAKEAIKNELDTLYLYPDTLCYKLRNKLSQQIEIPAAQIYVGNGGIEILFNLAHAYLATGTEVIMGKPSFGAFTIGCLAQDADVTFIPLKNYYMDCEAMLKAIGPKTKMVYLVTPNNPTGALTPNEDIRYFMDNVPPDILVVIDEAYWVFAEACNYQSGKQYVLENKNVLVLRSLSKHLGLAGLRVGYAFGRAKIIDNLYQVHLPFHVNNLAQTAAIAALDDKEFIEDTLKMLADARTYYKTELEKRGLSVIPTGANFICINLEMDDRVFFNELEKKGVIVRPGSTFNAPGYIRVTLGTLEVNRIFFQAFDEVMEKLKK
ncbi:histidinol-phosphate transaminase [Candidatus Riflebacteria bacterium]